MKSAVRVLIVVLVVATGVAGLGWMIFGRLAGESAIGNAQVVGGVAGVVAAVLAVASLWPRRARRAAEEPGAQLQAAVRYLATETLWHWQRQASLRRIKTPSPASVRWSWAGHDLAVPAVELQLDLPVRSGAVILGESSGRVLTAGVVTELRQQLYQPLAGPRSRMVILGSPGAGKTAAMLLLLIDILEHRTPDSDEPAPVWLTLGGWDPRTTSIEDWAEMTLIRDYPGLAAAEYGGPDTARTLIRAGRVALFLDGLDEMVPALQGRALQELDRDAAGIRLVLTSRPTEYRAALQSGRLHGAAVIEVLPVGVHDATTFLLAEQLAEHRQAWQHVTDHIREHPDSTAARTLTTPLALSLARDTYTHADPTDLLNTQAYPTPDALLHHLLDRFLTRAYPDPAEHAHTTQWLSWIARHMDTNRDLRWWDIPTWTPRWQLQLTIGLVFSLVLGLGNGLWFGLAYKFPAGLDFGPFLGLAGGLMGALMGAYVGEHAGSQELRPQTLALPRLHRRDLGTVLLLVSALGLGFAVVAGLATGITFEDALRFGIVAGLGIVLPLELVMVEDSSPPAAHAVDPPRVYRSDRRRTLALGAVFGLTPGIVAALAGMPQLAFVGLLFGLACGFALGTGPAAQLTVIQTISWLRGRPVRFMALLQTALHRQVLRQAGGVYQFRHAALQDYLKALEPTN